MTKATLQASKKLRMCCSEKGCDFINGSYAKRETRRARRRLNKALSHDISDYKE